MKKLLLLLLCLPMIGFGQCMSGDCKDGYGTYTNANGEQYVGDFKDGLFHGIGAYTFNDGELIQEGLWEMGEIIIKLEDIYVNELNRSDISPVNTESDEDEEIEIIEEDDEIFMVVENMPEFPGGNLGLMKYIQRHVKYPPIAREYNITGKVYVSFIVDKSGSVTNVIIVRGVDKRLDLEAFRVISSLPKHKPGKQRGKLVRTQFTIPINFTLN